MRTPCEVVVRYLLPAFRALIAKKMIEQYGFSQVKVAKILGTSQASISHYINSKRGAVLLEKLSGKVGEVVDKITARYVKGEIPLEESIRLFCSICETLRREDLACMLHKEYFEVPENCAVCVK